MKKIIDVEVYQRNSDTPWTIGDILDICTIANIPKTCTIDVNMNYDESTNYSPIYTLLITGKREETDAEYEERLVEEEEENKLKVNEQIHILSEIRYQKLLEIEAMYKSMCK